MEKERVPTEIKLDKYEGENVEDKEYLEHFFHLLGGKTRGGGDKFFLLLEEK